MVPSAISKGGRSAKRRRDGVLQTHGCAVEGRLLVAVMALTLDDAVAFEPKVNSLCGPGPWVQPSGGPKSRRFVHSHTGYAGRLNSKASPAPTQAKQVQTTTERGGGIIVRAVLSPDAPDIHSPRPPV